jgi:hypothetical protein
MKCVGFENMLPLYLEGQLKGPLLLSLNAHAADCSSCQHSINELREAESLLAQHFSPVPILGPYFSDKVMESIHISRSRDPMRYAAAVLGVGSIVAFLVTIAKVFHNMAKSNLCAYLIDLFRTFQELSPTFLWLSVPWPIIVYSALCIIISCFWLSAISRKLNLISGSNIVYPLK